MESLSDQLIVEAYWKAKELQLNQEFIHLIKREITRRKLIENENIKNSLVNNYYQSQ